MATVARPDPQAPQTTYLSVQGIADAIDDLHSQSPEGDVNRVWNSILNWVFDPVDGFTTAPQAKHTQYGGTSRFSDFLTSKKVNGVRRDFIITQIKGAEGEGWESVWNQGTNQLQDYLTMQHQTRPTSQRTPVYGILAIGRRVRFFRYVDTTQSIEGWRPTEAWALAHGTRGARRDWFHIIHEAREVQSALRHILHYH